MPIPMIAAIAALLLLAACSDDASEQDAAIARTLAWDDLIPNDYTFNNPIERLSEEQLAAFDDYSEEAFVLFKELKSRLAEAPVVAALDGQQVKLPGFVIPLEFAGDSVTEFLLVPYYGACIHTPPPPANQIVYVTHPQGVNLTGLWDPVWVSGEMRAQRVTNDLAAAGYTLIARAISPYQVPAEPRADSLAPPVFHDR